MKIARDRLRLRLADPPEHRGGRARHRRACSATPAVATASAACCGCAHSCSARPARRSWPGARQALSIGLILMVISETQGRQRRARLHHHPVLAQGFQIPEMWSGVIVLGLHRRRARRCCFGLSSGGYSTGTTGCAPPSAARGKGRACSTSDRCARSTTVTAVRSRRSPTSLSTWTRASSSASSAHPAAARPLCCAASAGCSSRRRATCGSAGCRSTGPPDGLAVVFQEYGRSLFPWLQGARERRAAAQGQGPAPG